MKAWAGEASSECKQSSVSSVYLVSNRFSTERVPLPGWSLSNPPRMKAGVGGQDGLARSLLRDSTRVGQVT